VNDDSVACADAGERPAPCCPCEDAGAAEDDVGSRAVKGSPGEPGGSFALADPPGLQRAASSARSSVLPSLSRTMCSSAVTELQPLGTPGVKPVIASVLVAFPNPTIRARPQSRSGGHWMLFRMPNDACTSALNAPVCASADAVSARAATAAGMTTHRARRMSYSFPEVLATRRKEAAARRGRPSPEGLTRRGAP
jgi:hypothetical protein